MATISDVATLAQVSVTTVSRVINQSPHVSAKKRKQVEAAMATLGYSPLQAARQMRGSGSKMIGVTVPNITNPFFSELVSAITKRTEAHGYMAIIFQTGGREDRELLALDSLKRNQVDGMIMCAIENEWAAIQPYEQYGVLGVCNEYVADPTVPMVYADQEQAMFDGVTYLLKRGYRKLAFCTGQDSVAIGTPGTDLNNDRYRGYVQALKAYGLKPDPDWLFTNMAGVDDGRALLHQLLALKARPDAVVTGADQLAAGVVAEADKLKLSIPRDLAVMGFDDQPISTVVSQPLTTIHQPIAEIGDQIAGLVLAELTGENAGQTAHQQIVLQTKVISRQSA